MGVIADYANLNNEYLKDFKKTVNGWLIAWFERMILTFPQISCGVQPASVRIISILNDSSGESANG